MGAPGLEPGTAVANQMSRADIALHPSHSADCAVAFVPTSLLTVVLPFELRAQGALGGIRTLGTRIKNPMLFLLSYKRAKLLCIDIFIHNGLESGDDLLSIEVCKRHKVWRQEILTTMPVFCS